MWNCLFLFQVRFALLVIALCVGDLAAQNSWSPASWNTAAQEEVQVAEDGALILGNVDPEVNLASRKPATDQTGAAARVTDGNTSRNSAWSSQTASAFNFFIQVDLEEARLVNRVVIVPVRDNTTDFIKGYSIETSLDNLVFKEQLINNRNLENLVDTTFTPVVARYVRVKVKAIDRIHVVQVSEIEIYGGGFLSAGSFVAEVDDFGVAAPKNFGQVRWDADVPEGTKLTMQFRTGPTTAPNDQWSDWTEPIAEAAGTLLALPEPRRYFQYQVNLAANDPSLSARLTRLEVDYGDPLAAVVSAEVVRDDAGVAEPDTLPADEVPVGQMRDFLYRLQAEIGSGSGFDILRLKMPNHVSIKGVLLGGAELIEGEDYALGGDGVSADIGFAQRIDDDAELEVRFSTVLFDELNLFSGQILDAQSPDNPQEIEANGSRQNALAIFGAGLVEQVFDKGTLEVVPNPFSPDGDGRFDAVQFRYQLAKLNIARPVTLHIFDLTGRPLRHLELQQKSGTHVVEWDGRDDDGERVPPGLYLFQVEVDSGDGIAFNGTVGVAY